MPSKHVLLPTQYGGDGDKAVCGVRISGKAGRAVFTHPREMQDDGCERCYFRILRTWQEKVPDIDPVPSTWPSWPWDAKPHVKYPAELSKPHDVPGWKPE